MSTSNKYIGGVLGGLAGGMVFGMMMAMMNFMPTIAKMVGSDSAALGWVIHLIISVAIGLFFAWWFGNQITSWSRSILFGMIHGVIWWILGPLTIMPVKLGMGVQYSNAFSEMNLGSLMGHLIYGVVLAVVLAVVYFAYVKSKSAAS